MTPPGSPNGGVELPRGGTGSDCSDSEFESFVKIDSPVKIDSSFTGGATTSATPVEKMRISPEMVLKLVRDIEQADHDILQMEKEVNETMDYLDEMELKEDELNKLVKTASQLEKKAKCFEMVEMLVMQNLKVKQAKGEDHVDFKFMIEFYDKVEELVLHSQNIELAKEHEQVKVHKE